MEPKFSVTEIVFVTILIAITDLIGIALITVGLDDFFLLDIIRFPISQFYLRMKGVRGKINIIANALEAIPYVGALPIATFAWLIIVWADRHPESQLATGVEIAGKASPINKRPERKFPTEQALPVNQ